MISVDSIIARRVQLISCPVAVIPLLIAMIVIYSSRADVLTEFEDVDGITLGSASTTSCLMLPLHLSRVEFLKSVCNTFASEENEPLFIYLK